MLEAQTPYGDSIMVRGRGACPAQLLDGLESFGARGPLARPVGSRRDEGEEGRQRDGLRRSRKCLGKRCECTSRRKWYRSMTIVVAGIDVSKKTLDVHPNGRDDITTNDKDGFGKIARILKDGGAERAVLEATGRMHSAPASRPRMEGICPAADEKRTFPETGREARP